MSSARRTRPRSTRGGQTRRRAVLAASALAVAVLAAAVVIATRPSGHQRRLGRETSSLTLCQAQPTAGLRAELTGPVPSALRGNVQPLGMSGDGRAVYVATQTPGFSGVAIVSLASGSLRRVRTFPHPADDEAFGNSDNRWLVWAEVANFQQMNRNDGHDPAVVTIRSWDSATGQMRTLGHARERLIGVPVVSGHYAAWGQGSHIMVANLLRGRPKAIGLGNPELFFDGNLVVWPGPGPVPPDAATTLHAYSVVTGKAATLPRALESLGGTDVVVTDGVRTAYVSRDLRSLYYSSAPDQAAHVILHGTLLDGSLALGPGWLGWTDFEGASYLASTRTGVYVEVTQADGGALAPGPFLLIQDFLGPPTVQAPQYQPSVIRVIAAGHLSWPACHGT